MLHFAALAAVREYMAGWRRRRRRCDKRLPIIIIFGVAVHFEYARRCHCAARMKIDMPINSARARYNFASTLRRECAGVSFVTSRTRFRAGCAGYLIYLDVSACADMDVVSVCIVNVWRKNCVPKLCNNPLQRGAAELNDLFPVPARICC